MSDNYIFKQYTIALLYEMNNGNVPWFSKPEEPVVGIEDKNIISGLPYHGISRLALIMDRTHRKMKSSKWVSVEQAHDRGWNVSVNGEGTPIAYWKPHERITKENVSVGGITRVREKSSTVQVPCSYYVYNITQVDGAPNYQTDVSRAPSKSQIRGDCDRLVVEFIDCPTIDHGYEKAAYSAPNDLIGMPRWTDYTDEVRYYQALFHELIHSTGNVGRLHRKLYRSNTTEHLYSEEELVADIGTLFLCSITGIEVPKYIGHIDNYIAYWSPKFNRDENILIRVAYKAEEAVRYILNEINIFGELL